MIAPLLVAALGVRAALIAVGLVVIAVLGAGARAFARIDVRATGRINVLELVANVLFFRALRVDALEGVVAQLEEVAAPAGRELVSQGEHDDARWYLVEKGELEVRIDGFLVNELARRDGFGELALMRDAPRAATVRARTDVVLLSLERAAFLAAIAGPDLRLGDDIGFSEPGPADHADVLGRTALLQGVGGRVLEQLARGALVCEAAAGTPIVVEGNLDDCFYVLLSGRAVVIIGVERRRVLLPGDGFGEIAVLHRVPRSATVLAEEDCQLLSVPGDDYGQRRGSAAGSSVSSRRGSRPTPGAASGIREP
jgi:CRP-like cAMP-binding protein